MALSSVHALVSRHLCLLRSIMVYSSCHNRWKVLPDFFNCRNYLCPLSLSRQSAKSYATKSKKKEEPQETPTSKEAGLNMDVCVGANIFKTGEDPPIKDDSKYPEWLWGLLDKDYSPDSKQYWRRLNKKQARERNALQSQLR